MGPEAKSYNIYSIVKSSWSKKRVERTLAFRKNGDIQLIGETDELPDIRFNLFEVYQLVWSDPLEGSQHPTLAFTFKDQRK